MRRVLVTPEVIVAMKANSAKRGMRFVPPPTRHGNYIQLSVDEDVVAKLGQEVNIEDPIELSFFILSLLQDGVAWQ